MVSCYKPKNCLQIIGNFLVCRQRIYIPRVMGLIKCDLRFSERWSNALDVMLESLRSDADQCVKSQPESKMDCDDNVLSATRAYNSSVVRTRDDFQQRELTHQSLPASAAGIIFCTARPSCNFKVRRFGSKRSLHSKNMLRVCLVYVVCLVCSVCIVCVLRVLSVCVLSVFVCLVCLVCVLSVCLVFSV